MLKSKKYLHVSEKSVTFAVREEINIKEKATYSSRASDFKEYERIYYSSIVS